MRTYIIEKGAASLSALKLVEREKPNPGPGQVLIRVRACSLNFRDQLVVQGRYFGGPVPADQIPLSDGAGEIVEIGLGVTRFRAGDRVAGTFFQNWLDGPPNPDTGAALGGPGAEGMLTEYVALSEASVVPIAKTLSFEEAATLPCAGVTAWNALMEGPRPVRPGEHVLVLGTGGVSLLALQIARAAGAIVIATSSSDEKLKRARALGAAHGINYRETKDWGAAAATLTGGNGVDHVIEVGGAGTLAQSCNAVGFGGEVALIGVLAPDGAGGPHGLLRKGASLRGIFVGSRGMAIRLNAAIDAAGVKPVIDRVFPFEQAAAAYQYQASSSLFGKVVITV